MSATLEFASLAAELCQAPVDSKRSERAEAAALLRFGGGLDNTCGRFLYVSAATAGAAARLASLLERMSTRHIEVIDEESVRPRVRIHHGGEARLAQDLGLVTKSGSPVLGLPAWLVARSADPQIAAAAVRGAVLAAGRIPGNSLGGIALTVTAPGLPAAVALRGLIRHMGGAATLTEARKGTDERHSVVLRRRNGLDTVLAGAGAAQFAAELTTDCNHRRGGVSVDQVRVALDQLRGNLPASLATVASARLIHPEASLEELGRHCGLTKSGVAASLRRIARITTS